MAHIVSIRVSIPAVSILPMEQDSQEIFKLKNKLKNHRKRNIRFTNTVENNCHIIMCHTQKRNGPKDYSESYLKQFSMGRP